MRTQDIATTNRNQPNNRNQLDTSSLCVAKGSRIHGRLKTLQIIRISVKLQRLRNYMVRFFWLRCRYKNERLSGKDLTYGRNVSRGDICKFYRYWSKTLR